MAARGSTGQAWDVRRGDWIYACHVFLAASMAFWRILAATPALAATNGGTFESSPVGRALSMVTLFGGVLGTCALFALSLAQWRDAKTGVLLVLFILSAAWRMQIDVFDLVYVAVVAILASVWLYDERPRRSAAAIERSARA